jgi:hypothetical protein
MSSRMLALSNWVWVLVLGPLGIVLVPPAWAEDAALKATVVAGGGEAVRTVPENLELALTGSWPTARVIDLRLLGTGAGFVISLPDPPLALEAVMTRADKDILLDYVLTIGKSEICGCLRVPPGDLGKPLTVARLYTYQIDMTLTKR